MLQICKENNYNFEMVYSPDTLNTNQATLNYLKTLGINSAFLAREIPLDEKMMIACCSDGTRPVIFKIERIDEMEEN